MLLSSLPSGSKIVQDLTSALKTLAAESEDRETRDLAADVLSGKRDVRDILSSDSLIRRAESRLASCNERLAALSPQDREALDQQAQEAGEQLLRDPAVRSIQLRSVPGSVGGAL